MDALYLPSVAACVDNDMDRASLRHEASGTVFVSSSVDNETKNVAAVNDITHDEEATLEPVDTHQEKQLHSFGYNQEATNPSVRANMDAVLPEEEDEQVNSPVNQQEDSVMTASIVPVSSLPGYFVDSDLVAVEQQETENNNVNDKPSTGISHRRWVLATITLLGIIAAEIVAAVLVTNNTKKSHADPSTQVQQKPPPPLDFLYLQEIRSILDPSSLWTDTNAPQLRATESMACSSQRIDVSSPRLYQRYALLTLYFSSGGETWPFDPTKHECDWPVIECSAHGFVTKLNFGTLVVLTGRLVSEIGLLGNLTHINVERNRLQGTIPETLFDLTHLESLRLSSNQFTSTLNSDIGKLSRLQTLSLSDNFFEGTLPLSLTNLTNLQQVRLRANLFQGSISHFLPSWPQLETLDITDTYISGSIPTEIGLLTNMVELLAVRTRLTGTIPSELGHLTNLQIAEFVDSFINGTIPTAIGNLHSIEVLLLSQIFLSSTIPTQLGTLSKMQSFSLSVNSLTGTIPTELGLFSNVEVMLFNSNRLTGTVPTELGQLVKLRQLKLFQLHLTGSMPSELCALRKTGALVHLENTCQDVKCDWPDCCSRCFYPATTRKQVLK